VFPDNDERCFLITIGGSNTALSGPAIDSCPRRAAAEGREPAALVRNASRRDNGSNSVAWRGRSVMKEIAGRQNRLPPPQGHRG
jgi:hypothetical protein